MTKAKKTQVKNENKESKILLSANLRKIFGKKLKRLRKDGSVPGNVYGPDFKSLAVTLNYKEFLKTYKKVKETAVFYLKVDEKEIPVLIKNIQKHPIIGTIIHVDLRKIDLKQKIQTEVPVKIIGESIAVTQKAGVLLNQTSKLLVEALPQDIPQSIDVDISSIKEIGQEIKVSNLTINPTYTIKEDANKIIVSVIAHKEESIIPETTAVAPEVITEKVVEGETTEAVTTEKPAAPPATEVKSEKK